MTSFARSNPNIVLLAAVQLFPSVTVTVYVPVDKPVIDAVDAEVPELVEVDHK